MSGRDTPPSIQQGKFGYEPASVSNFDILEKDRDGVLSSVLAVKLGKETFDASTSWLNSGRRSRWSDSLRAFQNLHPSGSKYLSGDYRFRSQLFRPKTRTMVRRDEAATASAFFANEDVVSITAPDDDDPKQQASAEILKALLQYRLANAEGADRIPWFLTLVGARQDADVMGIAVGKVGWKYEERFIRTEKRPVLNHTGMPQWNEDEQAVDMESVDIFEKIADHPFIDLISPENFRFEPGCDWRDVVRSSPYLIELQPFYISECLERMESKRGSPAEWLRVSESALHTAQDLSDDVTRRTRETGRIPGQDSDAWKPRDFDIAWTRCYCMKWRGEDWYFRTIGSSGELLEAPRPLSEVFLHGERPYVVGYTNIETHKTYPTSKVELVTDLQRAANQDWNSRFDAIMLSLQPRQFVREGTGQDVNDLRTFMPGKVVFVPGPKDQPLNNQVTWDRPPPVDGASFQEQDRINLDWDDLTGAFTNSSQASSQITQQSATGMHLMSGEASGMNEYELRVFAETWVEPILRLLIKTEQAYETDEVILALATKNANLFQRFGIDKVTDDLLNAGVTVRVNCGIGATNPQMKLRNFAVGAQIIGSMFGQSAAMGANFQEVSKELFSLLGYKDGARFFQPNYDPRVTIMQQQLQKAQGKGGDGGAGKVQAAQIQAQSRLQERQIQAQTDQHMAQMDFQTKQMAEDAENQRVRMKIGFDQQKLQQGFQHDHAMATQQHQQNLNQQANAFVQDQHMAQQANQHALAMSDRGFQQDQAAQANQFMNDRYNTLLNQQHDMGMAQQDREHETQMTQQGQQHDVNMQRMQPGPNGQTPTPAPVPAPTAPAPAPVQGNDQNVQQFMQALSQENVKMGQTITEAMSQLAQVVQQGNVQLAQALSSVHQQNAYHAQRTGNALESLAATTSQHAASNDAILQALTRKRKVVRGVDGRIEGVE